MKKNIIVGIIAATAFSAIFSNKARADEDFSWLSIAPEIGYVHFFKTRLDKDRFDVPLSARNGMVLKGHVDIGGDGIALELAPLWELESAERVFGKWSALGGEITLVYRGAFGDFYPSIGVGFHGSGIVGNVVIKSGAQLFARVPLGFTWYFSEYLGLVFEVGVMYGGTGLRMIEQSGTSQEAQEITALAGTGDIYWGPGFAFDIMAGLRFP
jgi:hypothetical protein